MYVAIKPRSILWKEKESKSTDKEMMWKLSIEDQYSLKQSIILSLSQEIATVFAWSLGQ